MKKQNCKHEFKVVRELSPKDKLLTGRDIEVQCSKCKQRGYVRWSELEYLKRR